MALDERVVDTSMHDPQVTTLLFMHIPKTAGTSLRVALGQCFERAEQAYLYESTDLDGAIDPRAFHDLPEPERARLRFVMGHFGFGIHESIPGPARYVTMVRDPVDRVASIYYHYKTQAARRKGSRGWREQKAIAEHELSLEDWVFGQGRLEVDNAMVRMISGRAGVRFGMCSDDMLVDALAHVEERFDAVLVRGLMLRSADILGSLIGRPLPAIEFHNVNRSRDPLESIDPGTRSRIRELNHLDAEFFGIMLDRFPATYDRLVG